MKSKSSIYLIFSKELDLYKIGVSKDSYRRKRQIQTGFPYSLVVLKQFKSDYPFKVESALHNRYKHLKKTDLSKNLEGEWFCLEKQNVEEFESVCQTIEKSTKSLLEMGNPFV